MDRSCACALLCTCTGARVAIEACVSVVESSPAMSVCAASGEASFPCYICPMCQFESPTMALSLSHLRLLHGSDPSFCVQCGLDGCSYTGKSFSSLYSHIYRHHPDCGIIQKRARHTQQERERATEVELPACSQSDFNELPGTVYLARQTCFFYMNGLNSSCVFLPF